MLVSQRVASTPTKNRLSEYYTLLTIPQADLQDADGSEALLKTEQPFTAVIGVLGSKNVLKAGKKFRFQPAFPPVLIILVRHFIASSQRKVR